MIQVPPYEPRLFPLPEDVYDKMLEVMPEGHWQPSSASVCSREEDKIDRSNFLEPFHENKRGPPLYTSPPLSSSLFGTIFPLSVWLRLTARNFLLNETFSHSHARATTLGKFKLYLTSSNFSGVFFPPFFFNLSFRFSFFLLHDLSLRKLFFFWPEWIKRRTWIRKARARQASKLEEVQCGVVVVGRVFSVKNGFDDEKVSSKKGFLSHKLWVKRVEKKWGRVKWQDDCGYALFAFFIDICIKSHFSLQMYSIDIFFEFIILKYFYK